MMSDSYYYMGHIMNGYDYAPCGHYHNSLERAVACMNRCLHQLWNIDTGDIWGFIAIYNKRYDDVPSGVVDKVYRLQ